MTIAEKSKLPDGREIRALEGTYTQKMMFTLRSSGLYVPANEGIMTVKDFNQAIQSDADKPVTEKKVWRTGEYAFYRKGFEKSDLPLGDKLVYVKRQAPTIRIPEIEKGIVHTLNIPYVPVSIVRPDGESETVGLRKATGMGVIKLEKLELKDIDGMADVVSVTTDFDPATDVKVVDIMRPDAWALVDSDGYPMRKDPSHRDEPAARFSVTMVYGEFDTIATGWHGSLTHNDFSMRSVTAKSKWQSDLMVAVITVDGNAANDNAPVVRSVEQPEVSMPEASPQKESGRKGFWGWFLK